MGFQARLCLFFLLTFLITCFARKIPYGNGRSLASEKYDDFSRLRFRSPLPPTTNVKDVPIVLYPPPIYNVTGRVPLPMVRYSPPPPVTNVATSLLGNEGTH
ncbi:uncharacterized protein LOC132164732 [Corylus avellana]|uniref:uncharacterized protein LOC132164732 n=1 Tax=Corylus avellana TaxID=13451 RepID=UPI00286C7421|nr:uncharacterized protein LOC132164732 [Corylus avellana]